MIEIAAGIFWDNTLSLYDQSEEAQELLQGVKKIDEEFEACDNDNERVIFKEYSISDKYILRVDYIYVNTPDSREWGGLKQKTYTVYGT